MRSGPAVDADDHGAPTLPDDDAIIGGMFGIEYRDCKGEVSTRDIMVKAVAWKSEKLQIRAHCLLRDAYRSFIAQNILTLAHGRTGEIIPHPVRFFGALAPDRNDVATPRGSGFADPPKLSISKMRKDLRETVHPAAVFLMATPAPTKHQ